MVRTRFRAYVIPSVFYAFSALVAGYFVWHAINGQRGLKTRDEYAERITNLQATLDSLRAERARRRHDMDLVRGEAIDQDMLEEQARIELGRIQKNEVVIFLPGKQGS